LHLQSSENTQEMKPLPNLDCVLCGKQHQLYKCDEYHSKKPDERLAVVKSKRCCFNCLSRRHSQRECTSKRTCMTEGCRKRHHTTLDKAFETYTGRQKASETPNSPDASNKNLQTLSTTSGSSINRQVFLQVVPIKVSNASGKTVKSYALLDGGSQCTIIRKTLCQSLNLPGRTKTTEIGTLKGPGDSIHAKMVELEISLLDGRYKSKVHNVFSVDNEHFHVPGQYLRNYYEEKRWQRIQELNIRNIRHDQIEMLIGADVPAALISSKVEKQGPGMPFAVKTLFGWTLGNYETPEKIRLNQHCNHISINSTEDLNTMVQRFWDIESFGTEVKLQTPLSIDDERALQLLETETRLVNNHYVVPMIWKPNTYLPESFTLARRRLDSLSKRFQRHENFFKMYANVNIQDYVRLGFARKMSPEEVKRTTAKTWYLPHHDVTNVNKPGKVRVVFDAAARSNGTNLNDNLKTGPDLLNSLVGVLIRFREHPIAVTADIEAMFHQVKLNDSDKDAVRFLWRNNPLSNDEPDHYQMLVHIFGAKDSPYCACYALQNAAKDANREISDVVVETINDNFYMDDLIKSVEKETDAIDLIRDLCNVLQAGGFKLTKFNSNISEVLDSVPPDKRATSFENSIDSNAISRALGIRWNLKRDGFIYTAQQQSGPATKRNILKVTSTVFDPLGTRW